MRRLELPSPPPPPLPPLPDPGRLLAGDEPRLELPRGAAVAAFGRRVQVEAEAGGWTAWLGGSRLLTAGAVQGAEPSAAWIGPGSVARRLGPAGLVVERWQVALELPLAVWEVAGPAVPITVAWAVLAAAAEPIGLSDDATRLRVGRLELSVSGGQLGVDRRAGEAAARIVCQAVPPVRITVTASSDDAERARLERALGRGGAALGEAWRQLGRSAMRLETPEPPLDRGFDWAWRRVAMLDPATAMLPPPAPAVAMLAGTAARFLADPAARDPAPALALVGGVVAGLWGVADSREPETVTLAPSLPPGWPGMALRRLRVGRTLLDLELKRRHGDLVARVRRVYGPRLVVTLEPRGGGFETAVVDEVELLGGRARFEASERHEIRFRRQPA